MLSASLLIGELLRVPHAFLQRQTLGVQAPAWPSPNSSQLCLSSTSIAHEAHLFHTHLPPCLRLLLSHQQRTDRASSPCRKQLHPCLGLLLFQSRWGRISPLNCALELVHNSPEMYWAQSLQPQGWGYSSCRMLGPVMSWIHMCEMLWMHTCNVMDIHV